MAAKKKSTAKKKAAGAVTPKKKAAAKAKPAAPKGAAPPKQAATPRKAAAKKAAPKKKAASPKKATPKKAAAKKARGAEATPAKVADAAPPVEELLETDDLVEDEAPAEAEADGDEAAEAPRPKRRKKPIPPMPPRRADGVITVAFSPDADDAFMFYGLLTGKVDTEDRAYDLVRDEIQTLNVKAQEGVYDVTAISFGAWPYLQDRYLLLPCGASFGDGRGPILIARTPIRTHEVNGLKVAIPGRLTTAALALRVWLPYADLELIEYPFDEVIAAVRTGSARAGVLIHERQLTYREENFVRVVDFGQWWGEKTEGLPLPLGANAIRRDIPEEERAKIALDIKRSIAYGLGHREEALDYSMQYAKGLPRQIVDKYVGMYVNELALDYAERGRQAVRQFLDEAIRLKLVPADTEPEFA